MIDVKKQGNVYTVFITDITSGATARIPDFDRAPPGFPRAFTSQGELIGWAAEHGHEPKFNFIEKVRPERPQQSAAPNPPPQPSRRVGPKADEVRSTALIHYRRLLDRHAWCAEGLKQETMIQLEAVQELMLELWDDIGEDLKSLEERASKPKRVGNE